MRLLLGDVIAPQLMDRRTAIRRRSKSMSDQSMACNSPTRIPVRRPSRTILSHRGSRWTVQQESSRSRDCHDLLMPPGAKSSTQSGEDVRTLYPKRMKPGSARRRRARNLVPHEKNRGTNRPIRERSTCDQSAVTVQ